MKARVLLLFLALSVTLMPALSQTLDSHALESFNQRFIEAHRRMDNTGVMSMWADDGVSLLPNLPPIAGKPAIQKFLEDVTSKLAGFKTISHDLDFRDIQVCGDWASEWAVTRQVVKLPTTNPC